MNDQSLQDITEAIASFLPGWRFDSRNEYKHIGYLLGPNNARLYISKDRTRGKLRAGGSFPDIHNRQYTLSGGRVSDYECARKSLFSSIGFSASKGAKMIAQDLKNRLIPEYIALLHLANKERIAYIEKSDQLVNRVNLAKKITPVLHDNYHYRRNRNEVHYQHEISGNVKKPTGDISIRANYYARSTGIQMQLNGLSDEQAIKILSIINQ